ncbi:SMI1/KNR4 family protein [Streptomyces sp. NPDC047108]|uniref:SMI1/KNR4 family protein n=1 Tax=Streptomyces sp. NPDC047108 TaxID=3155025 RepID=UPI00340B6872
MTASMTESWVRIEIWLSRHAPASYAELAPPAERAAIAAAERAIGLSFPDALVESLLRHDGTGLSWCDLLPPFYGLLSADGIVDTWKMMTRVHERLHHDEEPGVPLWWHRQWIPFATDRCGDFLVIDQRPTADRGRIGEADKVHGCEFGRHAWWASLPVFFETTAAALETGEALDADRPVVTEEGELEWAPSTKAP